MPFLRKQAETNFEKALVAVDRMVAALGRTDVAQTTQQVQAGEEAAAGPPSLSDEMRQLLGSAAQTL